jgi:hypothetical protein
MKIVYGQASDVLRITFSESAIEESDEDKPGTSSAWKSSTRQAALRTPGRWTSR